MHSIENNLRPFEFEILSKTDQLNEYIMTKLRLSEGMAEDEIITNWGADAVSVIAQRIDPFLLDGKVEKTERGWKLTHKGTLFADGIAAALFEV